MSIFLYILSQIEQDINNNLILIELLNRGELMAKRIIKNYDVGKGQEGR